MVPKLAAVLAADVVGYSRLMDGDEEGTLAVLKTVRAELTDPQSDMDPLRDDPRFQALLARL